MGFGQRFEMLGAQTVSGVILAAAGLVSLCSALGRIDAAPSLQPWRADGLHPVAALAWAEARCDSHQRLVAGTPRLQAEDLLQISARFDALEEKQGHAAACETAISLAAAVATESDAAEAAAPSNVVASVR
jgi:hypothetical protein